MYTTFGEKIEKSSLLNFTMLRLGVGRAARIARPLSAASFYRPLGVRFNSTKISAVESAPVSEITNLLPSFDSISAVDAVTLSADQYGYLQSIGFATGWGPTGFVERLLEITHVTTGLPWWTTIIASTVLLRVVMFPLYVKASGNMARMSKIKPQTEKLITALREAETQQERALLGKERSKLNKENGVNLSHSLLPMVQIPFAYGFFQALRKMANYPVEGFLTQGAYWFEDLTQVDPYLGLQVLSAAAFITLIKLGGETGAQTMNPMMKKVMIFLPLLSILITKDMSSAVVLYFAVNATFSLCQGLLLRSKMFRKFANIPAIVPPVQVEGAPKPPATISEWWKDFNEKMKKQSQTKMTQTNRQLDAVQKRRKSANDGFIKRH